MRKAKCPRYKYDAINELVKNEFFNILSYDVCGFVEGFENKDHNIQLTTTKHNHNFLGGGVWDGISFQIKLGENTFVCKSFLYAIRCIYGYLKKYNPDGVMW